MLRPCLRLLRLTRPGQVRVHSPDSRRLWHGIELIKTVRAEHDVNNQFGRAQQL